MQVCRALQLQRKKLLEEKGFCGHSWQVPKAMVQVKAGKTYEFREGAYAIVAASKEAPTKFALLVDRGAESLSRYVVCLLYEGHKGFTSPFFTPSLAVAAKEYEALSKGEKL